MIAQTKNITRLSLKKYNLIQSNNFNGYKNFDLQS